MAALSCGQELTESVVLDADLSCPDGDGLRIEADDVVLDLGGHTISGTPDVGQGVEVDTALRGAVVKNGRVTGFEHGIRAFSKDVLLERVTVTQSSAIGANLHVDENVVIKNSTFSDNGGWGVLISGVPIFPVQPTVEIDSVSATDNGFVGLSVNHAEMATITNSVATGNATGRGIDISLTDRYVVQGNDLSRNQTGISVSDGRGMVLDNDANDNRFGGITVFSGAVNVEDNRAHRNGLFDGWCSARARRR